jgi:hypothetical protein
MNRTRRTARTGGTYANASSNRRDGDVSASATQRARALFDEQVAAGGSRGTAQSAGDRDRLVASGTKGPGSDRRGGR